MSRKMTKSDLSRADISLLINSEEAKNTQLYGNLYDILVQIRDLKAITLEELKIHNLNHDGVSALTHNRHTLIDNANTDCSTLNPFNAVLYASTFAIFTPTVPIFIASNDFSAIPSLFKSLIIVGICLNIILLILSQLWILTVLSCGEIVSAMWSSSSLSVELRH